VQSAAKCGPAGDPAPPNQSWKSPSGGSEQRVDAIGLALYAAPGSEAPPPRCAGDATTATSVRRSRAAPKALRRALRRIEELLDEYQAWRRSRAAVMLAARRARPGARAAGRPRRRPGARGARTARGVRRWRGRARGGCGGAGRGPGPRRRHEVAAGAQLAVISDRGGGGGGDLAESAVVSGSRVAMLGVVSGSRVSGSRWCGGRRAARSGRRRARGGRRSRRRWRAGEPRARGRRARAGRGSRVTRAARRWSSNRTSSAAVGVWATSTARRGGRLADPRRRHPRPARAAVELEPDPLVGGGGARAFVQLVDHLGKLGSRILHSSARKGSGELRQREVRRDRVIHSRGKCGGRRALEKKHCGDAAPGSAPE
jgi:hypothetical protein